MNYRRSVALAAATLGSRRCPAHVARKRRAAGAATKYDEDDGEPHKDRLFCDDCCKVCGANSKLCGDSCISENYTCHVGYGCACDRL